MTAGYIGTPGAANLSNSPGVWPIDEIYNARLSSTWLAEYQVSGGTVTQYTDPTGTYRVHTFTSAGTLVIDNLPAASQAAGVDYLLVSGGGAGGNGNSSLNMRGGGGGGGGATQTGTIPTATFPRVVPVTIGSGGASAGAAGGTSTVVIVGSPVPSTGGNGGGSATFGQYGSGGSGSGGPSGIPTPFSGGTGLTASFNFVGAGGGGGGGDAGIGGNGVINPAGTLGQGGAGTNNSITGTSVTYARGGAGGGNGSPNTLTTVGSGGQGGVPQGQTNGQNGVFIVRYKVV